MKICRQREKPPRILGHVSLIVRTETFQFILKDKDNMGSRGAMDRAAGGFPRRQLGIGGVDDRLDFPAL
jgi:hypothetical protein